MDYQFQGKVTLLSSTPVEGGYACSFSFTDALGKYTALDVNVGDTVILDGSNVSIGKAFEYTLTGSLTKTFDGFAGTLQGEQDPYVSLGIAGIILRRSPNFQLSMGSVQGGRPTAYPNDCRRELG
jgi:hypothetical protein